MGVKSVSALSGTLIPIFFQRVGVGPAVASGPLITTVNDLVAVAAYYGLARSLLPNALTSADANTAARSEAPRGGVVVFSGLAVDLGTALGAGNDDLALARRYAADGPALAGEILMVLIGAAGLGPGGAAPHPSPPAHELLVLQPAAGQVLGEHSEQDEDHQQPEQQVAERGRNGQPQDAEQQLSHQRRQIQPQQRLIQPVHAVSPVHKARHGASELIEHTLNISFPGITP